MRAIRIHQTGGPEVMQASRRSNCRRRARARSGCASTRSGSTSSTSITAPASIRRRRCRSRRGRRAQARWSRSGRRSRSSSPATGSPTAGSPGAYAEERNIEARFLFKLPRAISYETAAGNDAQGPHRAISVAPDLSGEGGRHDPGPCRGRRASGSILCQWGKALGATVIGCVGSAGKGRARQEGGRETHDPLPRGGFRQAGRARSPRARNAHVVYDGVGKATFPASLDCLRPFGVFVSFGSASGGDRGVRHRPFGAEGLAVRHPADPVHVHGGSRAAEKMARDLFRVVGSGDVKIQIGGKLAARRGRRGACRAREARNDGLARPLAVKPALRPFLRQVSAPPAGAWRRLTALV